MIIIGLYCNHVYVLCPLPRVESSQCGSKGLFLVDNTITITCTIIKLFGDVNNRGIISEAAESTLYDGIVVLVFLHVLCNLLLGCGFLV